MPSSDDDAGFARALEEARRAGAQPGGWSLEAGLRHLAAADPRLRAWTALAAGSGPTV